MKVLKVGVAGILALTLISCESLQQVASTASQTNGSSSNGGTSSASGTITQSQATTGIKQALGNGLDQSIKILSAKDGFLGDQAVKILMPEEAQRVESALRSIGMGKLCDQFITSMNRAAESAVKEASSVFISSLSRMSVNDAFNILLSGQQDAATQFFKTSTSAELTERFSPIINQSMNANQVSTYWTQLTTAYNNLPVGNKIETDLTNYITQRAIDGLFVKVADEELKIRQNLGGARNTNVLKDVFGWADQQKKK